MSVAPLPPSTLVIASRNRPELLRDCVRSILRGDQVPAELVIIDQSDERGPSLDAPDTRCRVRHLFSRSVGLARAKNEGLAAAAHDLVAFTDDDMIAPASWYGALIRALVAAGPRAVVTGRVLAWRAERVGGFAPAVVVRDTPAVYEGRIGTDVLAGGNMAMSSSVAAVVGGFDERLGAGSRFPAAEDNDFGYRLLEARYRIVYVADALLYHRAWRPGWDYWTVRWRYGRGKGGFYCKHLSLRDRYVLRRMLRDIFSRVLRFPWFFVRHPFRAGGDPFYLVGILFGIVDWYLGPHGRSAPATR
ncbi:MAG: glycosyltransferase [Deltaproteobacteria bacterium]|nr:glycosyltransferase [Deltaproteobacteria bacterium]